MAWRVNELQSMGRAGSVFRAVAIVFACLACLALGALTSGGPSTSRDVQDIHDIAQRRSVTVPSRHNPSADEIGVVRVINAGQVKDDHSQAQLQSSGEAAHPEGATADDDLDPHGTVADWYPPGSPTYRTVCVRLCDGAMTPVSFATTRDRFALDALRCRKSCNSPTRLFVQPNPSGDPTTLRDLDGKRYESLPTAFRFRTTYDEGCTCRSHAWQVAAQARHRRYAEMARVAEARRMVRNRTATLRVSAAKATALAASAPASEGDPAAIAAAEARTTEKGARAGSGGRRAKAKALARVRGLDSDEVLAAATSNDGGARTMRQADVARRRFDGTDWRITSYEPL